MNLPSIDDYINALHFDTALAQYAHLEPLKKDDGSFYFSSGNFAVVFKMRCKNTGKFFALKVFHRYQEGRIDNYKLISECLENNTSPYLVKYHFLEKEIWVNSHAGDDEYPAIVMDWVEGKTLGNTLQDLCRSHNTQELTKLAYAFDEMALWLLNQDFAHGDLKSDNLLVDNHKQLKLVDYDGLYTPAMAGSKARENGSPHFRHPKRDVHHFGKHIDDFSLLLHSLSLHTLAHDPSLLGQHGAGDSILFTESELANPGQSNTWQSLTKHLSNTAIAPRYALLHMACANPSNVRVLGMEAILGSQIATEKQVISLNNNNFVFDWLYVFKHKKFFNELFSTFYHFNENELDKYFKNLEIGRSYSPYEDYYILKQTVFGLIFNKKIKWSEKLLRLMHEDYLNKNEFLQDNIEDFKNGEFVNFPLDILQEWQEKKLDVIISMANQFCPSENDAFDYLDIKIEEIENSYQNIISKLQFSNDEIFNIIKEENTLYFCNPIFHEILFNKLNSDITDFSIERFYSTDENALLIPTLTDTVTDIDGNVYTTVTIGTQTWMVENLKTTRFNDGSPISIITHDDVWINDNTPKMCFYNNNIAYKAKYGALYNWYAVDTRKLAPKGWHVPSDEEWQTLVDFLGGAEEAGRKLRSTSDWKTSILGLILTNEFNFVALPGGNRDYYNGTFYDLGSGGYWWSASAYGDFDNAWNRIMYSNKDDVFRDCFNNPEDGLSVRCLRD